ncbi:MAG: thiol:disulfide interchange protein, partial [Gemmatimonadaceae bacterium]|nr:thiol:disulfide interchange protein [Gemmatimonadaceae bacterium]
TVSAAMGRPAYGALLSLGYAIGRGIPFLLIGILAGASGRFIARAAKYARPAEVVSGIALLGLSFYFFRFAMSSG